MQWLELCIHTSSDGISALCDRLDMLGYEDLIIDDENEFQDFLESNRQYWDYVDEDLQKQMKGLSQVRFYLEDRPESQSEIMRLQQNLSDFQRDCPALNLGNLDITVKKIADEDWENSWKEFYHPIEIGDRLIVLPEWMQDTDTRGRVPVILDPGMIFGTGAHASTQMCMCQLEKAVRGGESVIDLGSGSGILSITALKLGADRAVGVDIDPKAAHIAEENAAMNQIGSDRFHAETGDVTGDHRLMKRLSGPKYNIVLANIVADVIIPLAPVVPEFMADDAVFICSGILETRLDEVRTAVENAGLQVVETMKKDDWCCMKAVMDQEAVR